MSGLLLFLLTVSIGTTYLWYLWTRLVEYADAVEERRWKWLTGNIGIDEC